MSGTNPYDVFNNMAQPYDGYGNYAPNMVSPDPYSLSSQLMYGGYGPSQYAIQGAADSYNTMANLGNTIGSAFAGVNAANQSQQRFNTLASMLQGNSGGNYNNSRLSFKDANSNQWAG